MIGFFPRCFFEKLSADTSIEISSAFEYQMRPPTPIDFPSFVSGAGGSSPLNVNPFNPKQYKADHFGQKLHVDQNEKLVMYGAVHVCARDGYSGMIVGFCTMPVKNNITIYDNLYRYANILFYFLTLLRYGLFVMNIF